MNDSPPPPLSVPLLSTALLQLISADGTEAYPRRVLTARRYLRAHVPEYV